MSAALWYAAIAAFVGGDYVTTKAGLDAPGVEESHPVADGLMGTLGVDAGMLTAKGAVVLVCLTGYIYARRHPETEQYAPLFPAILLLVGIGVTARNVQVLDEAGAL